MKPLVSIIVPVYNAEEYLLECLDSLTAQSYRDIEIIAIDDGSSDRSGEILSRYQQTEPRFCCFKNDRNRGISYSRNVGIEKARGTYIAWLDSDDVALQERIEIQVDFMEDHPEYGLVSSDLIIIDENSQEIGIRTYPHTDQEIRKVLTRYDPFAQPASLLRVASLKRVGTYDERLECAEDYDLFLRIAAQFKVANINQPLIKYRVTSTQSKSRKLKLTIRNTLDVQARAIAAGIQDSIFNRCYRFALRLVLMLPDSLILALFKLLYYR